MQVATAFLHSRTPGGLLGPQEETYGSLSSLRPLSFKSISLCLLSIKGRSLHGHTLSPWFQLLPPGQWLTSVQRKKCQPHQPGQQGLLPLFLTPSLCILHPIGWTLAASRTPS